MRIHTVCSDFNDISAVERWSSHIYWLSEADAVDIFN